MARFTIDIADAALPALQRLVERFNADNGQTLTLAQYLTLHVKEIAIQDELAATARELQRQAEAHANAALLAERSRLIDAL